MERTWRSVIADVGVVAATVAWGLVLRNEAATGDLVLPTGDRLVLDLSLAVVSLIVVVTLRHRYPVAVAVGLLPVSVLSVFAGVPGAVALFVVAWRTTTTTAVVLAGAHVVASLVHGALFEPNPASVSGVLTLVASHAVPVALGLGRRARLDRLAVLESQVERADEEQRLRVEQARQAERQRIAREMHDVLAHRISTVSLHAGALTYRPDAPTEDIARTAEIIRSSAHDALTELREVIGVLRGPLEGDGTVPERPQPTLGDVDRLLADVRAAGLHVRFHDRRGDLEAVPPALGRTAYRVVEEGLTNAAKHAPGAPAELTIERSDGALRVELVNAAPLGRRSTIPGAGAGLVGLTERVTLAGGRIDHGRGDDGTFRLEVRLPWTT